MHWVALTVRLEGDVGEAGAEAFEAVPVVRHGALDALPEAGGVVEDGEVGQLMDDDVVDDFGVELD